jgi:hypothetical protein
MNALPPRPLTTIITLTFFAFLPTASVPVQAEEPSLSETLEWMDKTYNAHSSTGEGFGHGREEIFSAGKAYKRRTSSFTYEDCHITLRSQDNPTAPLYSELYTSAVYSVNLRDIDPASITLRRYDSQFGGLSCDVDPVHMNCDVAEIEFETRNQESLIGEDFHAVYPKLTGRDHDTTSNKPTFVAAFYFDDSEYAIRFAKAFHHAVTLCGGKQSPFWMIHHGTSVPRYSVSLSGCASKSA